MMRIRTLLVDDADPLRRLIRLALERDGAFDVVGEAGDGLQGIELANTLAPDLVLLDLSMPRMDGLEALPLLRLAPSHPVIVVLSGFQGGRLLERARQLGAADCVEKGVTPNQLVERLLAAYARVRRRPTFPAAA